MNPFWLTSITKGVFNVKVKLPLSLLWSRGHVDNMKKRSGGILAPRDKAS